MTKNNEKQRIEEHSKIAGYCDGVMEYTSKYCAEIFKKNMIQGGSVLELGPAEGISTNEIYPDFSNDYTIVDGADFFVKDLEKRFPTINCICSLFEEYKPNRTFDNILLGHVLEHVVDPVAILKLCSTWLSPNGKILTAVPNSNSIHRQAAVLMGMLSSTNQLNETDKKNGHRRVYDLKMLEDDFRKSGLTILKSGGYWLKPLSNQQIDETWTMEMNEAFLKLGEKYPEIAAEIYLVAGA